jgi:uncharacterized DUF497 family protein
VGDLEFDGFEWEQQKSGSTLKQRGFDFIVAASIFDGWFTEREDTRRDYGEPRFISTGEVDGALLTVVWTPRARNRRIISAWPASNQERRTYREQRATHERRNPPA